MSAFLLARYDLNNYRSRIIFESFDAVFQGCTQYSSLSELRSGDNFILSRLDWYLFEYIYIRVFNPNAKIYYVAFEEVTVCPLHDFSHGLGRIFDGCAYWDRSFQNNSHEVFNIPQIKETDMLPTVSSDRNAGYISIYSYKSSTSKTSLYSTRVKIHNELVNRIGGRFYGWGWAKARVVPNNYSGDLPSKEIMKEYKFAAAIENTHGQKGNVTEKFFDAVYWGCIPVVWGDSPTDLGISSNIYIDISDLNFDKITSKSIDECEFKKFRDHELRTVFGVKQFRTALQKMLRKSVSHNLCVWKSISIVMRTIFFSKARNNFLSSFKYLLEISYMNTLKKMRKK
ncbi:glycosyltransferase family 10 [Octadecabacter sp.]|nr:glycosyltransferase family 10 [Octadecabacter sp.]